MISYPNFILDQIIKVIKWKVQYFCSVNESAGTPPVFSDLSEEINLRTFLKTPLFFYSM